ncbi:YoaK family protein [Allorhizobium sp. NPDC080224]|uniref:YoaK family protein n=1 Tax=Allorhizobium sp. NPDC080224 TaxID=3390547 RepID=UPI003CFD943C
MTQAPSINKDQSRRTGGQGAQMRLLRIAAAHRRTRRNDLMLGAILAFVAGAMNAGGFLAIGHYTSHMTGIVSAIADNLALGLFGLVGAGIALLASFTLGAACSAVLINWARRHARRQQYAYPLALESGLLIAFAGIGAVVPAASAAPVTALLLCFVMGLQNATITKISGARIRTTHLTGMITDVGIEFGKLAYGRIARLLDHPPLATDSRKLGILLPIVGMFFVGGLVGALGFKHIGHAFSLPLAALLLVVASPQLRPRPSHAP